MMDSFSDSRCDSSSLRIGFFPYDSWTSIGDFGELAFRTSDSRKGFGEVRGGWSYLLSAPCLRRVRGKLKKR